VFTGRAVAAGEPMWTATDLELALEWQAENNLRCGNCGQPMDESTDPDNARDYRADELTCYGCMVIELRRKALSEQEVDMAGVNIYARRVDGDV
jgi:hypothetical protein